MQGCHKLLMNRLAEHLSGVFGQVDDTLFECAEKAENNQVQTLFFDSMRDIRKQRAQIERAYHQQIAQNFADFIDGKLQPRDLPAQLDAEQLSLVQNEDYEESLLVTNMSSRVKARCAQALFALEQRLALLNNGKKLSEDSNPFGPPGDCPDVSRRADPYALSAAYQDHSLYALRPAYDAEPRQPL